MNAHNPDVAGAAKLRKYPHIVPGHPIHKIATKVHATVKAAHPDTALTVDDMINSICDEIEASGMSSILGDDNVDGMDPADDEGLDGDDNEEEIQN